MNKSELKKFRGHYFPGKTITESRAKMCKEFKEYGLTERSSRSWEAGQRKIQTWFVKVASDFDKDNIL